ncbi:MAG TPA: single-stranded-DNA-specific exonuclease RecJ [Edaphocola sp.]|nr:single-stranded-DNA-specific exonuclease RecJ [Edaphocola sp.]
MLEKKWRLLSADENITSRLYQDLKINKALCRLLALRMISNYECARDFFRPELSQLHDPFLMKGMAEAVKRIQKAIRQHEKVMIYGDYDVDGTTSVAVVYAFLKSNFPQLPLCYYIPHRYREGYGVSAAGIEKAANTGCGLIITLDCGIKSVEKAALAAQKGIDMIICDHHLPGDELPNASAILNPKQKDCPYPYKELSGCGIGYKLISAIARMEKLSQETVTQYLDLVATSIAADIVPMDGENRILAYYGLKRANELPCVSLQKIKEVAGLKKEFTISDLVFLVAPRINAAGRMDDAGKAVSLFIEDNPEKALEKALDLQQDNSNRKDEDRKMTEEALRMLQDNDTRSNRSTVLFQPHWHKGVVGIVASRVQDSYYRPTIILTESNGMITGSARSVRAFNIHDALVKCESLLENFGGHFFAAGMTLKPENLEAFKEAFEQAVRDSIQEESLYPEIQIEAELSLKDIQPSFFNILKQFEPFGPTNLPPVFISRRVINVQGKSRIVKDNHIRFVVRQDGTSITGIGFGLAEKFPVVDSGDPFDIVYRITENEWQGTVSLQLQVLDVRMQQE